ncbi:MULTISPECIES: hypothetical protein [Lactobacillus]|uniref:hypothetical protein n=1 Tax=Lactobacillus TaxID=1578 RepID=UPI001C6A09EB|nr:MULTISPECIES: hypothetical protein [Lactobacillus]MCX8721518.1 hypothetical protein [Lactobacillus sp. B4010]MCX8724416.1 hypothetical protein [Lactobacillus sp. B4005]MCX8733277.1 hypothetical protein [Lactobacillus sp. B4015]MCX8735398.1 hypothetical protein [Lactobacillus sp. B4012]QYN56949.1 hypothetical protein GYM69_07355 [Lactobacillus panisapium]
MANCLTTTVLKVIPKTDIIIVCPKKRIKVLNDVAMPTLLGSTKTCACTWEAGITTPKATTLIPAIT